MAEQNKFGSKPDANPGKGAGALRCEEWEALLADALDGLLPAGQAVAFEAHSAGCTGCSDLLAHAKQGQQWLEYLHVEPEVPSGLVSKILEKTAGAGAIPVPVLVGAGQGTGTIAVSTPWRSFHETRLLMTVAMAFFSIALTLNMAGVKLTNLRLADLRPATLGNTLSRQFYGAREQVVKFYNNARFVYQLESKVRELRRDTQSQQQAAPEKQQAPAGKSGEKDGRLAPAPEKGEVLNAEHRSAAGAPRAEDGLMLRRVSGEAGFGNEPGHGETNPTDTEAHDLNSLGPERAGQRRESASAGYEGRSLA